MKTTEYQRINKRVLPVVWPTIFEIEEDIWFEFDINVYGNNKALG